jgi:uncharacterized MAPEG superfamily protein
MSPTAAALLAFVAWTIVLVVLLALVRVFLVATGKSASSNFSPDGDDVEGFGKRLTRAHANCYENLPLAGAVLLYAIATDQTAVTDGFAFAFLAARFAQSLTHLTSTARPAVMIRFLFYVIQVCILSYWILGLAHII